MRRDGAGAAGADHGIAHAHDREHFVDGAGDEGLVGLCQLLFARTALLDGETVLPREREHDTARYSVKHPAHGRSDDLSILAEEEVISHRLGDLTIRHIERLVVNLIAAERYEGEKVIDTFAERIGTLHAVWFEHRAPAPFLVRGLVYPAEKDKEARLGKGALVIYIPASYVGAYEPLSGAALHP